MSTEQTNENILTYTKRRSRPWCDERSFYGITEPFYNFWNEVNHFQRENIRTTHYGFQTVRYLKYLGPKIWDLVPNSIRNYNTLNKFKKLFNSPKPNACSYRLCKNYVAQVGIISEIYYILVYATCSWASSQSFTFKS